MLKITKDTTFYVTLNPVIEEHYDRVSIKTICTDSDENVFIPEGWDAFNPIKVPMEDVTEDNLDEWAHEKAKDFILFKRIIPFESMSYENDVYILDEETGEKIKDNETGEVLIKHKKGDLVKKRNGTPRFAERVIHPFCEISEIEII